MREFEGSTIRHGTYSGYAYHLQLGNDPCPACWKAKHDYDQRRMSAPKRVRMNRLRARAQGRALRRLKTIYNPQYRALYAEELDILLKKEPEG